MLGLSVGIGESMKRIRSIGNYVICQTSVSDKKNLCTSDYLLITKEEMQYSPQMREIEFEADNIQELIDFVEPNEVSMKKEFLGVNVVAHNRREEKLVYIIANQLDEVKRYRTNEVFDNKNTMILVCIRNLDEISSILACMFYIDMISADEKSLIREKLDEIKNSLYL